MPSPPLCAAAAHQSGLPARARRCKRSYAATVLQRALPRLALGLGDLIAAVTHVMQLLASNTQRFDSGRSRP